MDWHIEPIPHFTLEETRCKCGCGLVVLQPALLRALEQVRAEYDKPIVINSMVRCHAHNTTVGGVANSYHLNGRAVDIAPARGGDLTHLARACTRLFPFTKRYDSFVHCDVRGERPYTTR